MKATVHYTLYNASVSTWLEAKRDKFRYKGVSANMLISAFQQKGKEKN